MKEKVEEFKVTEQEQELLKIKRQVEDTRKACADEITEVLAKHGCQLAVDMTSPLNALRIIVTVQ